MARRAGPGQPLWGLGLCADPVAAASIGVAPHNPLGPIAGRALALLVLAVVVFGVSLPRLGLLVATALLGLIASLASAGWRWRAALVTVAVLTAGSWAVCVWGLKLDWPLWPV